MLLDVDGLPGFKVVVDGRGAGTDEEMLVIAIEQLTQALDELLRLTTVEASIAPLRLHDKHRLCGVGCWTRRERVRSTVVNRPTAPDSDPKGGADMLLKGFAVLFPAALAAVAFVGPAHADVIDGTNDDDVLVGTPEGDFIRGFDGADRLFGREGSDQLRGGEGDDYLAGGKRSDGMLGGAGNDTLVEGSGNFSYSAGGFGNDRLLGSAGSNFLLGAAGRDRLRGAEHGDFLVPGYGVDRVRAGKGTDYIYVFTDNTGSEDSSADLIDCGAGRDRVAVEGGAVDPKDEFVDCELFRKGRSDRIDKMRNRFTSS